MKLTNRQLDTLAQDISSKISKRCKEQKEKIKATLKPTKLSKDEEKAFKLFEQAIELLKDTPFTNVIQGNYYDRSSSDSERLETFKEQVLENQQHKQLEKLLKEQGYTEVNSSDIASKLVLASIDSDSLDTLVENLAKELGLKSSDLK
jgi:hypothetical protein